MPEPILSSQVHRARAGWWPVVIACWLVATVGGTAAMSWHASRSGKRGNPPALLTELSNPAPSRAATLLMFAHPMCPCTRASIGELARIMAHADGHLDARVIFLTPPQASGEWSDSDLVRSARAIPGVQVEFDPGGVQARKFGAPTSGLTLVYDQNGVLRFSGGITAGRGHAGDNAGEDAILNLLQSGTTSSGNQTSPVFGCAMSSSESR